MRCLNCQGHYAEHVNGKACPAPFRTVWLTERSTARHTPARVCDACEGFCLQAATIDEANTALAVAMTLQERLAACESLAQAAQVQASLLRNAIANARAARNHL